MATLYPLTLRGSILCKLNYFVLPVKFPQPMVRIVMCEEKIDIFWFSNVRILLIWKTCPKFRIMVGVLWVFGMVVMKTDIFIYVSFCLA